VHSYHLENISLPPPTVLYLPSLSYTTIYYLCNIFKKTQFLIFIFYVYMQQYLYNKVTCKALSCNKSITIYALTLS